MPRADDRPFRAGGDATSRATPVRRDQSVLVRAVDARTAAAYPSCCRRRAKADARSRSADRVASRRSAADAATMQRRRRSGRPDRPAAACRRRCRDASNDPMCIAAATLAATETDATAVIVVLRPSLNAPQTMNGKLMKMSGLSSPPINGTPPRATNDDTASPKTNAIVSRGRRPRVRGRACGIHTRTAGANTIAPIASPRNHSSHSAPNDPGRSREP